MALKGQVVTKKLFSMFDFEKTCGLKVIKDLVDEDKNLYFDFALAGVSKDSIELTKTGKQIEITVKASEEKDKFAYTHKGIKFPKDKDVSIATIDVTDKYDAEPTVSFENGLLKLKFTIKPEEKPKKLSIK